MAKHIDTIIMLKTPCAVLFLYSIHMADTNTGIYNYSMQVQIGITVSLTFFIRRNAQNNVVQKLCELL